MKSFIGALLLVLCGLAAAQEASVNTIQPEITQVGVQYVELWADFCSLTELQPQGLMPSPEVEINYVFPDYTGTGDIDRSVYMVFIVPIILLFRNACWCSC